MIKALNDIEVITLYAEDLTATKAFYQDVFGLEVVYEDEVSAVVRMRHLMINLLSVAEAPKLIEPAPIAEPDTGTRLLFTIQVTDVDSVCEELAAHGIALLNGPIDRPWGRRTAAFADPAGNIWEVAQHLS
jgi:catechol 2,3-dioxygenase-like lactoylglutathione lyase family enzyme